MSDELRELAEQVRALRDVQKRCSWPGVPADIRADRLRREVLLDNRVADILSRGREQPGEGQVEA